METEGQHESLAYVAAEAFNDGDLESLLGMLHPDLEVTSSPELPNSGVFHGEAGFLRWLEEWLEAWESFQIEIERLEILDERLAIAAVHQRGRGKGSGLEIDMHIAQLWEIEDGKVFRFQLHATVDQAHEAAEQLRD